MNKFILESNVHIINELTATMEADKGKFNKKAKKLLNGTKADKSQVLLTQYREFTKNIDKIDFGKIPESKGNLLKVYKYDTTVRCIDTINELVEKGKSKEVDTMNRLHDIIISLRSDFEYGFRFNINFIESIYNLLVLNLYELVQISILAYGRFLSDPNLANIDKLSSFEKTKAMISANSMIGMFNSGEWKKLMKEFKTNKVAAVGESVIFDSIEDEYATEAVAVTTLVAGVLIALLWFLNPLIRYFLNKAAKLSNYLDTQAEFLQVAINAEKNNSTSSDKAIKRQESFLKAFIGISEFIKVKLLKAEAAADKETLAQNRNIANVVSNTDLDEFEII